jgi:glycosyltransferase involved in cell wall biosynthesis
MKIAFVYDALYPYVKGGAERRYYELARALRPEHQVHLFGMRFWDGDDLIENEDGVCMHGVCPPKPLYVDGRRSIYQALYFSYRLILPLLRCDFDVVDCSSVPFFPILVCKAVAIVRRRPLFVTWHEVFGDFWRTYLGSDWKAFLARMIETVSSKLPDRIVAISEHTKADLELYGVPEDRIGVIHCGIDLEEILAAPVSSNVSDIMFAGRLIKDKNVDLLIQAIHLLSQSMPSIRCFIVGDGPERENLERLRADLELEGNIEFLGFLPDHKDVYGLMKASKLFVLPSAREGFGMVVPEANACGLPTIVVRARHNAAAWLVQDGVSGFVCDLDATSIADSALTLLTDDGLRARLSHSADIWARRFDWKVAAEETLRIYGELIHG